MRFRLLLGLFFGSTLLGQTPHGTLTWRTLPPGGFYPGTPHTYAVYRPPGIDPAQPAAFMVFLDGRGAIERLHIPAVFDALIAEGALPRLVGVFVDPGVLPVPSAQFQNRYERIFEYDSLSDRFSRFLLEELLPAVAVGQRLSANPDDHAIAGVSTGAVGAFVAAWRRPDQFHRVLSLIGTYVDMKGAEELPSLVRKTEPRPIRIFLQDGRNDHIVPGQPWGTFFAGSWPINNQVMYEALTFAGYDVTLVMGEGQHNTEQGAAIMPQALRWLWAGYPRPITVHEPWSMGQPGYDPRGRVYSIVSAEAPWEPVGPPFGAIAAVASDRDGNVFLSDTGANRIYRVDPQGHAASFRDRGAPVAALRGGPDGRVYAAEPERRRIVALGAGGEEKTVAEGIRAEALALTAAGGIYFLDPGGPAVGFVGPGRLPRLAARLGGIAAPSALALSPDQGLLVVTDRRGRFCWSYQVGADGSLRNGEPFYRLYTPEMALDSGLSDVASDVEGRMYFAGPLGLQVAEQNGRIAAVLNGPEFGAVSRFTFGGPDQRWLYAAAGRRLYRRPVKISGAAAWAPVKPPTPAL